MIREYPINPKQFFAVTGYTPNREQILQTNLNFTFILPTPQLSVITRRRILVENLPLCYPHQ